MGLWLKFVTVWTSEQTVVYILRFLTTLIISLFCSPLWHFLQIDLLEQWKAIWKNNWTAACTVKITMHHKLFRNIGQWADKLILLMPSDICWGKWMEMMRLICHNFTHNHCETIFTLIKYHKSIQSDLLTRLINNMTLCNLTLFI